ncbi:MAG TPA: DUF1517 domain-containing protein [Kofleriaceae bacterium]|jgi:uncharacterized membrane protein
MRILAGLFVLLWFGAAFADTGGSMGGGDWSSTPSRPSTPTSYSSTPSTPSTSYNSNTNNYNDGSTPSYSSSGGGGGGWSPAMVGFAIVAGILFFGGSHLFSKQSGPSALSFFNHTPGAPFSSHNEPLVDVSVLRIALDGRARKFVQANLARIAETAETKTPSGRLALLRETSLMLRKLRDAWIYGGAVNEQMREMHAAKPVFDRYVDDARTKFMDETVRNDDGNVTTAAVTTPNVARSDQGEGVILVSIVVAAKTELFTVEHIGTGEDLRKALEAAPYREASDLVALEIVWQPSEDADRLTSIALEAKYPKPALIPLAGALVGKTFCTYCGGPFPAELVSCPHCGAPAKQA